MDNNKEIDLLRPYLMQGGNLKILDIGFGKGNLLTEIINAMPKISKIIGVDINKWNDDYHIDFVSFHNACHGNKNIDKSITEIVHQDGFAYLECLSIVQDLIIFSNILHFNPIEKQLEILQIALTKLSPNGIIYIKNANEHHTYNKQTDKFPFSENQIAEIESFAKIETLRKSRIHYELIISPLAAICPCSGASLQ